MVEQSIGALDEAFSSQDQENEQRVASIVEGIRAHRDEAIERVMSEATALREAQELEDRQPFKNPRNAAAGSLRQKDSGITAARGLSIFVFNLQRIEGKTILTHKESLDYIRSLGFPVSPRYTLFDSIEDAIAEIRTIGELLENQIRVGDVVEHRLLVRGVGLHRADQAGD